MFGSDILDVAIGMIFIFLLLSLVASAIREGVEGFVKARAVHLERGIRELLDDPAGEGLSRQLYEHPLIFSLYRGQFTSSPSRLTGGHLPSYIPARTFATALIDLLARGPSVYATGTGTTVAQLRSGLDTIGSDHLRRAVTLAIESGGDDLSRVQANLEQWFNDTMDRVSGWYRRRTQLGLFVVGAVLAVGMNIDSVAVVNHLWRNRAAREALAARATAFVNDSVTAKSILSDTTRSKVLLNQQMADLDKLALPIGWGSAEARPASAAEILLKLFGIIVTTFAVTLGAPFWFDALKRLMVIRSTVKPSEATGPTRGEAAQGTSPAVASTAHTPPTPSAGSPSTPLATPATAVSAPASTHPDFVAQRWADGETEEGLL